MSDDCLAEIEFLHTSSCSGVTTLIQEKRLVKV